MSETFDQNEEGTPYRTEALYMTEDTSVSDVLDFMRSCIENPIEVEDKIVWNFSTHEIDSEALEGVAEKREDKFIIPYQVTGAWGFMFTVLPEEVRNAEILVYDTGAGDYKAYRSLYRTTAQARIDQMKDDLSRRVVNESGKQLGLVE